MELTMVDHFRNLSLLLDKKNDKHERIYKTNRDITVRSKRIIYSLHRIPGLNEEEKQEILASTANDIRDIERSLLKYIAMELKGEDSFQFIAAYTGGLQEYIEAVSFHRFLLTEAIITHTQIVEKLTFKDKTMDETTDDVVPLSLHVPPKEYMLGLADLTGELMRYCIKSIGVGDFEVCYKISDVLKQINAGFLTLGYIVPKELYHKVGVFKSSLAKVEDACYSLQLRKSELPADMLAEMYAMGENLENNAPYL